MDEALDRQYEEVRIAGRKFVLWEPTLRKLRELNAMFFDLGSNFGHLVNKEGKLVNKVGFYSDYLRAINSLQDILIEALDLDEETSELVKAQGTEKEISEGISALGRLINPLVKRAPQNQRGAQVGAPMTGNSSPE